MNKFYIAILASCAIVATAAPWQTCTDTCTKNSSKTKITYPREEFIQPNDTLTSEEQSRAVRGEPEQIPQIRTVHEFITHIESKLAKYQKMLKQVEHEQAGNRLGTKEKYEAELATLDPKADGIPAWIFYEKRKEKLNKKIQNAESELGLLKKCVRK